MGVIYYHHQKKELWYKRTVEHAWDTQKTCPRAEDLPWYSAIPAHHAQNPLTFKFLTCIFKFSSETTKDCLSPPELGHMIYGWKDFGGIADIIKKVSSWNLDGF